MIENALASYFEKFLNKESLFRDKRVLQANFFPDSIFHRDEQIKKLATIIAPCLKLEKPSNLFIYGKSGTGKTLTVKHVGDQILQVAREKDIKLKVLYINCKLKRVADTEYRLIAQFTRDLGKEIPSTGLPTDEVYKIFFSIVDSEKQLIVLILDEIDYLVKKVGDELLYNLTRINSDLKNSQISLIGISNNLMFSENLDPRIKSSLSKEELVSPPYNALQLQDILTQRCEKAFKKGSLEQGVVQKCAAYAAREHGDARRALELLRVSAEMAERKNCISIKIEHLDEAEKEIEKNRVKDIIFSQPKQQQLVLFAIISACSKRKRGVFTGEVYDLYKELCDQTDLRALTQRRVSDIIAEYDLFGVINTNVISKGRYGRTKEITLVIEHSLVPNIKKIIQQSLNL